MFLNETKPPLEEALVHFGVKGMRWGRRKGSSGGDDGPRYNSDLDYYDEDRHRRNKKLIAAGALALVGTAATVAVLHKTGHLKVAADQYKQYKSFKQKVSPSYQAKTAYNQHVRGKVKNHSFRPKNVGNPLFTVHPKEAKDFVDAGFGKNGVFNVGSMARGAKTVKDFDADVWDVPMRAITSGRR